MNPVLLQKQLRDNSKDLQDYYKELQEWGDEMKRKDESCKSGTANDTEAPKSKVQKTEEEAQKSATKKPKRIKSCDYKAWEKFDADAYCKKMDKEAVGEPLSDEGSDDLSDEFDESMVDLANVEKEKGNTFVKKQRWDDAVKCYTKAIECYAYEPIYYANRALCHLKKQNYRNAEADCTTALQLDKKYVKAYQRRAAAREALNQLNEARDDLLRVLELEKNNTESKAALVKLEKKMERLKQPVAEPPRPVSKFTLSRQKHKPPIAPPVKNEIVPALKAHVVENIANTSSPPELKIAKESHWLSGSNVELFANTSSPPKLKIAKESYWPSGSNVELFESLTRPRKARSGKPLLKRIEIDDVDLQGKSQLESDKFAKSILEIDQSESKLQATVNKRKEETFDLLKQISENVKAQPQKEVKEKDAISIIMQEKPDLQIPKTSVQFYKEWKSIGYNRDLRSRYMKQISPKELPDIFKESLESKVFSEMLETLSVEEDRSFIYDWLAHLTNVKRFSTLAMFMSAVDKKRVSELFTYLREDNRFEDAVELCRKYGL